MSTIEEVEAAKRRMDAASKALDEYVHRPSSEPTDIKRHLALAEELREAVNAYVNAVSQLGRK